MTKHKKQHYIPSCYSKAWCDSECPPRHEPYIWVFGKNSKEGRRKAPENMFHETDMYTIEAEDGGRNLVIEHGLCGLESTFTKVRNHKLNNRLDLTEKEHIILCAFISAMRWRTKSQKEHIKAQWKEPLKKMEELMAQLESMTDAEQENMAKATPPRLSGTGQPSIGHEEVKALTEKPLQMMLVPAIKAETPLLTGLDLAIFCTDDPVGFITSDNPCVWFDPAAYKRHPFYRAPALMYETVEITLPISPRQCVYLNRQGINGYINATTSCLNELNRRVRFFTNEYFIVNKDMVDEIWFHRGEEPADSWDKLNSKRG